MHDTKKPGLAYCEAVADCVQRWVTANYPPAPKPAPNGEFRPDAILFNLAFEALDMAFYLEFGNYMKSAELSAEHGITAFLTEVENDRASSTWFRALDWFRTQSDPEAAEAECKRSCAAFFAPLDALLADIPHPEMPIGDDQHDGFVRATPKDPDEPHGDEEDQDIPF